VSQNKEQAVESLWKCMDEAIINSCNIPAIVAIMREVLHRIKNEMGLDDAFIYYSQYSLFMHQFGQLFEKHIKAVREESKAGMDGHIIESISDSLLSSPIAFLADDHRHRELFAEALKVGDFTEAQRIIDERAQLVGDDNLPALTELENWRINLAVLMGNIDGFIEFYKKAMIGFSGIKLVPELLEGMLKKILGTSMISGIAVGSETRVVCQKEADDVSDFFWDIFLKNLANAIEINARAITTSTFKCLVVTYVGHVTEYMNENLDVVIEVMWI